MGYNRIGGRIYTDRQFNRMVKDILSKKYPVLGAGTFGSVVKIDEGLAVKVISCGEKDNTNFDDLKFEFDMQLMAYNLCKPYVPEVYFMYKKGNRCFIFMEYVKGFTLEKYILFSWMTNTNTRPVDVKKLMRHLLRVVSCLHRHGIVHRDIKANNIIMDCRSYKVRLLDMGLSCRLKNISTFECQHSGMTNIYASPELMEAVSGARSKSEDILMSSDVWALGLTFAYLCHPTIEHVAYYTPDLYQKLMDELVGYPFDPLLDRVVRKMLTFDYRDRISAEGALKMLDGG